MIPLLRLYYNKLAFNILRRHTNPRTPRALASGRRRFAADYCLPAILMTPIEGLLQSPA